MAATWVPMSDLFDAAEFYGGSPFVLTNPMFVYFFYPPALALTLKPEYASLSSTILDVDIRFSGDMASYGEYLVWLNSSQSNTVSIGFGTSEVITTANTRGWDLTRYGDLWPYGSPSDPGEPLYIDFFVDLGVLAPAQVWTSFIGSIESNSE